MERKCQTKFSNTVLYDVFKTSSAEGCNNECEDLNLYDDLIISNENEKKLQKTKDILDKFAKAEAEVKILKERCANLEEDNKTLIWNISSLWKTAVAQLREKDNKINKLCKENESIIFNRGIRQIPKDKLDSVVARIAAYHKEDFSEFMQSLRSQVKAPPLAKNVSSYYSPRTPFMKDSIVRKTVVGRRISERKNAEALRLRRLVTGQKTKSVNLDFQDSVSKVVGKSEERNVEGEVQIEVSSAKDVPPEKDGDYREKPEEGKDVAKQRSERNNSEEGKSSLSTPKEREKVVKSNSDFIDCSQEKVRSSRSPLEVILSAMDENTMKDFSLCQPRKGDAYLAGCLNPASGKEHFSDIAEIVLQGDERIRHKSSLASPQQQNTLCNKEIEPPLTNKSVSLPSQESDREMNLPHKETLTQRFKDFVPESKNSVSQSFDVRSWKIPKKKSEVSREANDKRDGRRKSRTVDHGEEKEHAESSCSCDNFMGKKRCSSEEQRWRDRQLDHSGKANEGRKLRRCSPPVHKRSRSSWSPKDLQREERYRRRNSYKRHNRRSSPEPERYPRRSSRRNSPHEKRSPRRSGRSHYRKPGDPSSSSKFGRTDKDTHERRYSDFNRHKTSTKGARRHGFDLDSPPRHVRRNRERKENKRKYEHPKQTEGVVRMSSKPISKKNDKNFSSAHTSNDSKAEETLNKCKKGKMNRISQDREDGEITDYSEPLSCGIIDCSSDLLQDNGITSFKQDKSSPSQMTKKYIGSPENSSTKVAVCEELLIKTESLDKKHLTEATLYEKLATETPLNQNVLEEATPEKNLHTDVNLKSRLESEKKLAVVNLGDVENKAIEKGFRSSFQSCLYSLVNNFHQRTCTGKENVIDEDTFDGFFIRRGHSKQESVVLHNEDSETSLLQYLSNVNGAKCSPEKNIFIAVSPPPFVLPSVHSPRKLPHSPQHCQNSTSASPLAHTISPFASKKLAIKSAPDSENHPQAPKSLVDELSHTKDVLQQASMKALIIKDLQNEEQLSPVGSSANKGLHFQYSLSGFQTQETPSKTLSTSLCSPISLATPLDTANDLTATCTPPPLSSTLKLSTPILPLDLDRGARFPARLVSSQNHVSNSDPPERKSTEENSCDVKLDGEKEEIIVSHESRENRNIDETGCLFVTRDQNNSSNASFPKGRDGQGRHRQTGTEQLVDSTLAVEVAIGQAGSNLKSEEIKSTVPKKKVPFYTISREVRKDDDFLCKNNQYEAFGFASSFYKNLDKFEEEWPSCTKYIPSSSRGGLEPTNPTKLSETCSLTNINHLNNSNSSSHSSNSSSSSSSSTSSSSSRNSGSESSSCCSTCSGGDSQDNRKSESSTNSLQTSFTNMLPGSVNIEESTNSSETIRSNTAKPSLSIAVKMPHKTENHNLQERKRGCSFESKRSRSKSPAKKANANNTTPKSKSEKKRRIQPIPVTERSHSSSDLFTSPSFVSDEVMSTTTPLTDSLLIIQQNQTPLLTETHEEENRKIGFDKTVENIPSEITEPPLVSSLRSPVLSEPSTSHLFGCLDDLSNSQSTQARLFDVTESIYRESSSLSEPSLEFGKKCLGQFSKSMTSTCCVSQDKVLPPTKNVHLDEIAQPIPSPSKHISTRPSLKKCIVRKSQNSIKVLTPTSVILQKERRPKRSLSPSTTSTIFSIVYQGDDDGEVSKDTGFPHTNVSTSVSLADSLHQDIVSGKKEILVPVSSFESFLKKKNTENVSEGKCLTQLERCSSQSQIMDRALRENTSSIFNPQQVFRKPLKRKNTNLILSKVNNVAT